MSSSATMRARVRSIVADSASTKKGGGLVGRIAGIVLVLVALAILLALGTWQMERLAWKEGLLASIAERRAAPPVDLAAIEALAKAGDDVRLPHGACHRHLSQQQGTAFLRHLWRPAPAITSIRRLS